MMMMAIRVFWPTDGSTSVCQSWQKLICIDVDLGDFTKPGWDRDDDETLLVLHRPIVSRSPLGWTEAAL